MVRDGWYWLSGPKITVAVRIENGKTIQGPPVIMRARRKYVIDKVVFLGV